MRRSQKTQRTKGTESTGTILCYPGRAWVADPVLHFYFEFNREEKLTVMFYVANALYDFES